MTTTPTSRTPQRKKSAPTTRTGAKPRTSPVPEPAVAPEPAAVEEPKPGLLLKSYRLSLTSIEKTSTVVGGGALGSLRFMGIPKGAVKKMQSGQKAAVHGMTSFSDTTGTAVAHGVVKGRHLAVVGTKKGAKAWARGMKFFITLR